MILQNLCNYDLHCTYIGMVEVTDNSPEEVIIYAVKELSMRVRKHHEEGRHEVKNERRQ